MIERTCGTPCGEIEKPKVSSDAAIAGMVKGFLCFIVSSGIVVVGLGFRGILINTIWRWVIAPRYGIAAPPSGVIAAVIVAAAIGLSAGETEGKKSMASKASLKDEFRDLGHNAMIYLYLLAVAWCFRFMA